MVSRENSHDTDAEEEMRRVMISGWRFLKIGHGSGETDLSGVNIMTTRKEENCEM